MRARGVWCVQELVESEVGLGLKHGRRAAWSAWEYREEHDERALSVGITVIPNSVSSLC